MTDNDSIRVTYRVACSAREADALAHRIAYEQTVELPEQLVTDAEVLASVVGRVVSVEHSGDHALAVIDYNPELCNRQLSQLMILLFGNASIFPGVRIVDLSLPVSLLTAFAGPAFGADGLRRLLGVYDRPLLATAIKPRGIAIDRMAAMAAAFARGGGDIIKDDQNLADDEENFAARIAACQAAVVTENESSGRYCLYFPHISAPDDQLEARFDYVRKLGVRGVLLCPMILGLERVRVLARAYDLIVMAHPALTGSYYNSPEQGISHEILLGTLFRLAGADISIYPNYGGRFDFSKANCLAIRDRLLQPLGGLRACLPAPAGGMQFENLGEMGAVYGSDAVFLVGGSLQNHAADLTTATRAFHDQICSRFNERLQAPEDDFVSVCEIPGTAGSGLRRLLKFQDDFQWVGRDITRYKAEDVLPFAGVHRIELIGQHGERTAFDLRYFEIAPGGFTSLEKHRHTHVVIAVRGEGVIIAAGRRDIIHPMDIVYIAPMEIHQISNLGSGSFGFFCIVDHERDRPQKP